MNKIYRVFFHELGHFVAEELNNKYYSGSGSMRISIYPCESDISEYCGETFPNIPDGIDKGQTVSKIRLAEHLVAIIYGCIFQAYFQNCDLNICTDRYGEKDMRRWRGDLNGHGLGTKNIELSPLADQHMEYLRTNKILDSFMNLDPNIYLIEMPNKRFEVNISKLRNDISQLIITYFKYYEPFVKEHQVILGIN